MLLKLSYEEKECEATGRLLCLADDKPASQHEQARSSAIASATAALGPKPAETEQHAQPCRKQYSGRLKPAYATRPKRQVKRPK
ncbi:hypothetical protein Q0P47_13800, partial [Staphylococcus aureus]|nr:hypothetical protein [Staphylococcus aureus]